ncbi:unnamed protein product [Hymenolepis diminuta]|uniref:Exonuclease domain-containing protein n=2 Tax=Hymenolepis diminuta TaxID=6216 RepID=A0A564YL27_HYMDI|nr:unnamed protein product [Hymenolepis diminuta]
MPATGDRYYRVWRNNSSNPYYNASLFPNDEVQDTTTHISSAVNPGQPIPSTLPPASVYAPGYEYYPPTASAYYPMPSYDVQGYPAISTPTYQSMPSYTDQGMPSSSFIVPQNVLFIGDQHIPASRTSGAPVVIDQEASPQVYTFFQSVTEQDISQPSFTPVPTAMIPRNPRVEYPRSRALSVVADHEIPLSYPSVMPRLEAPQASFSMMSHQTGPSAFMNAGGYEPNPTVTINPFPNRNRAQYFNTQPRPRARSFERMPYNPRLSRPRFPMPMTEEFIPTASLAMKYRRPITYSDFLPFLLNEWLLIKNHFPTPGFEVGKAQFYISGDVERAPMTCIRCEQVIFDIYTECRYHPLKIRQYDEKTRCCQQETSSPGCEVQPFHIHDYNKFHDLDNYIQFGSPLLRGSTDINVFAIDCEMVYTRFGFELARATVVNMNGDIIYDKIVHPSGELLDPNTKYSGLTREDVEQATATLQTVQSDLQRILDKDTILIGHSLENDMIALKIIHDKIVDTSIVFSMNTSPNRKRGLKYLAMKHLYRAIQIDSHDSAEDARTCVDLMKIAISMYQAGTWNMWSRNNEVV